MGKIHDYIACMREVHAVLHLYCMRLAAPPRICLRGRVRAHENDGGGLEEHGIRNTRSTSERLGRTHPALVATHVNSPKK